MDVGAHISFKSGILYTSHVVVEVSLSFNAAFFPIFCFSLSRIFILMLSYYYCFCCCCCCSLLSAIIFFGIFYKEWVGA